MDKSQTPVEDAPKASQKRPTWLVGLAIVALAGVLFSFASLSSSKTENSALPASLQSNPVATQLYEKLADAQATSKAVEMKGYAFSPSTLQISVGDTVTWTNNDSAPHNVVVTDGPEKFSSPLIQQGQTFSHTFTQAGTYSYYCSVHPDMKATITVTGGGATTQPTTGAPTSAPAPSSSSSMPMPSSSESSSHSMPSSTPSSGTGCVSHEVLQPILDHVKSAHLETSPGQQVTDLLNLDQYVKTHTVWLEQVLSPVFNGDADQVAKDTLAPILQHVQSAHLETSLGQQVTDLLNLDQYIKTHTVWLEQVLTPLMSQLTC
ncbi:cupredoxin family copper-binding protein [Amycolatopsis sp. K13G38]|uniref:Cupredoxin family copper-binding protein n=1 Tax=Amycolatopsis acididurans TaxID=2724524 RepID=A0ABX1J578_9PSEU|nr:cupredoxin family copper-binding protein [Amycolatopsis acididurans]NKQ53485.1 cupredoxin family copper-binding protein [Amycolatopsis acididurans]